MLQHLRKHLIRIYTIIAGIILTVVFIITALFLNYQNSRSQYEQFTNHVFMIQNKLQNDNIISDSWLSNLEVTNHLIIWINDNGNPLFFPGMFVSKTSRSVLMDKMSALIEKEGISLSSRPVSADSIQSDIYIIKGDHRDKYYGTAMSIATNGGYRSFFLFQQIDTNSKDMFKQRITLVLINILGIFALFLLIRKLVDRSLQPVKENQQRQTQFIAAASHELRSPLAVIRTNNSLHKENLNEYENCERIIETECKRMSRLINDLLLLASGDANTWSLQKSEVNTDTLLLDSYESTISLAKKKEIRILLKLPDESLPTIEGDYERLLQILTILIDNAISYSEIGSSIELSAKIEKKTLSLYVIDHGIGILDEDKKRVFERFYRVEKSRKDKSHFGLGLSIAKELVTLHHGTIKIVDTIGGGSTFVVTLPRQS